MATNFPGSDDVFTEPSSPGSTALSSAGSGSRNHTQHHTDLGNAIEAMQAEATLRVHSHDGTTARHGSKLSQVNTHQSVDTDISPASLHHTTGIGPYQAAAGNHDIAHIVLYPSNTPPPGWLICNGAAISRTTYSSLYGIIGTSFGGGDGSTTFNIPNLVGRIPVGRDAGQAEFDVLGETGGEKAHTLTPTEMPAHTHAQDAHSHTQNPHNHANNGGYLAGPPDQTRWRVDANSPSGAWGTDYASTATNQNTIATNQWTGGNGAHNNLQPYIVLNYIIRV